MQQDTPRAFALDDLALPNALAKEYPHLLSPTSMQHLLRRRNENGLSACCVRIGKKIAVSRVKFEQWIASRAEVA